MNPKITILQGKKAAQNRVKWQPIKNYWNEESRVPVNEIVY